MHAPLATHRRPHVTVQTRSCRQTLQDASGAIGASTGPIRHPRRGDGVAPPWRSSGAAWRGRCRCEVRRTDRSRAERTDGHGLPRSGPSGARARVRARARRAQAMCTHARRGCGRTCTRLRVRRGASGVCAYAYAYGRAPMCVHAYAGGRARVRAYGCTGAGRRMAPPAHRAPPGAWAPPVCRAARVHGPPACARRPGCTGRPGVHGRPGCTGADVYTPLRARAKRAHARLCVSLALSGSQSPPPDFSGRGVGRRAAVALERAERGKSPPPDFSAGGGRVDAPELLIGSRAVTARASRRAPSRFLRWRGDRLLRARRAPD